MNANVDKNANAMASGNRLNAAKIRVGHSLSNLNICFKYKICSRELQKMQYFDLKDGGWFGRLTNLSPP